LRRGAAEIVGVGGDIAKTAHSRRLRLRGAVVGAAARRAGAFAGRRQLRVLHRNLRLGLRRLRPRYWRRVGAKVALLARVCSFLVQSERRTLVARLQRRWRTRARRAASDSTLRTASSSDSRSRVISDSLKGGCTLRSCAISAARARSYSARRLSPGALGSSPEIARAISG
jgi:hypothetical protein